MPGYNCQKRNHVRGLCPAGRESITESILLWKSDPVIFLLSKFHGKEEDAHGKDNNERTGAGAAAWHQPA